MADSLQVVHISSLAAALAKLNIGIPVEDVIEAVRHEEANRATLDAQALATGTLAPHMHPINTTPVAKFIPNPPPRTNFDPLAKERRRRLLELTKEAFPNGIM
ncbi:hypothetical protein C8R46DRAFT_1081189 [Mycena filopes]|nr:hypothetical protein C8R46DRAFT_1081189 [Mycena filopes]